VLSDDVDRALAEIEDGLLALEPSAADWPEQVGRTAADLAADKKRQLVSRAAALGREVIKLHVSRLPESLSRAVSDSLADDSFPRTTGSVAREIQDLIHQLQSSTSAGAITASLSPSEPALPADALEGVHRGYRAFRDRQLDPARLRSWWPLLAIGASLAFFPMWRDLWQEILGDDWLPPGWPTVVYLLTLVPLLLFAAWRVFHPWIERAVSRPQEFYTHRERGRLTALVRRKVRSQEIETPLRQSAADTVIAQRQRLAGEVSGQLQQVAGPLSERQREMQWLSNQLEGYLRLHGVEEKLEEPRFYANRQVPPVLYPLERNKELQALAAAHPPTEAQYSHIQRQLRILEEWRERFSRTFLDPHRFLDHVSSVFPTGTNESELTERLVGGIRHFTGFPASFQWLQTSALPQQIAFCSLPSAWQRLDGLTIQLRDAGFYDRVVERPEGERLFLVRARFGIPSHLIRQETAQESAR